MSAAQTIVKERLDQILADAVEERRRLILTHHSPRGWRTFKSCFVSSSPASQTILVDAKIPQETSDSALPQPGDTLGVTFRVGHKKCMFTSNVESIQQHGDGGTVGLRWPDQLKQLQRRAFERAQPPKNAAIAVRLWREAGSANEQLEARTVRHGQLVDVSAGGMRVKVAKPDDFETSVTYRCAFTPRPGKPAIIVHALVRHREATDDGRACIGFQFVGLETTPEGRRVLDRLARTVNQFQRVRSRSQR